MNLPPGFQLESDPAPAGAPSGVKLPPGFQLEPKETEPYQPTWLERTADTINQGMSKAAPAFDFGRRLQENILPGSGMPEMAQDVASRIFGKGGDATAGYLGSQGANPYAAATAGMAVAKAPEIAMMFAPAAAGRMFRPAASVEPVATPPPVATPSAPTEIPVVTPTKTGSPYGLFSYNDDFGPNGTPRSQYTIHGDPTHPLLDMSKGGAGNTTQTLDWFKQRGIPITGREPRSVGKWEPLDYPQDAAPATPTAPAQPLPPAPPGGKPGLPDNMNILQRLGTKGVNSQAGITAETVQSMARSGQNPADVGGAIGKRLVDEDVLGQSPAETFSRVNAKKQEYGQAVKDAVDKIWQANAKIGGGAGPGPAALNVDANTALKPLLDKKVALANSPFSANKRMARPWTEAYSYLADQADGSGGVLNLDHINGTMQQVGDMLGKLEKGTESYKNVSSLYGTLANMRDGMVNDIAKKAGDPALASNLLKANQGYSFYSRIMPDISWQAAADAVGGPHMSIMGTIKSEAAPVAARAAVKTGSLFSKSRTSFPQRPAPLFFGADRSQQQQ